MDIYDKIRNRDYDNKMPWPKVSRKSNPMIYKLFAAETGRLTEQFKTDLFDYYGMTEHPKREQAYAMAWERGHSSGFNDIAQEFVDLVDLIK